MPREARIVCPGMPHHVTQRGTNREKIFYSQQDRKVYLDLLRLNSELVGLRILAYCLMLNHIHLVCVPEFEEALAICLRRTHGPYAQYLNARLLRSGHLWQNRFYSCPLAETHLWRAMRYVELNPVRAGVVAEAGLYRYSSASAHLGKRDEFGILDMEFWEASGAAFGWSQCLQVDDGEEERRRIRRATYAGRPLGSETFADHCQRYKRKLLLEEEVEGTASVARKSARNARDGSGCPQSRNPEQPISNPAFYAVASGVNQAAPAVNALGEGLVFGAEIATGLPIGLLAHVGTNEATSNSGHAEASLSGVIMKDPKDIRFSQDSVSAAFREGKGNVGELITGLSNGSVNPQEVEAIRTFEKNGATYTLDNRRLLAASEAGTQVATRPATQLEIAREASKKMTTVTEGRFVSVINGVISVVTKGKIR